MDRMTTLTAKEDLVTEDTDIKEVGSSANEPGEQA